jgi:hypothetical protein
MKQKLKFILQAALFSAAAVVGGVGVAQVQSQMDIHLDAATRNTEEIHF